MLDGLPGMSTKLRSDLVKRMCVQYFDHTNQLSFSFYIACSPFSGTFNGNVRDVHVDTFGDVYVFGRECDGDPVVNPSPSSEDSCEVILSKLSAVDGSVLFTKRFSYLYHAHEMQVVESDEMIFLSSSMQDGASSDDGTFQCKNNVAPGVECSATLATDLQGEIIWARTVDHTNLYGFFTGSIMLAHEQDG